MYKVLLVLLCVFTFGCGVEQSTTPSSVSAVSRDKHSEMTQGTVRVWASTYVTGGHFNPNVSRPGISCSTGHAYTGGGQYRVYCDPFPDVCYQTSSDGSYIDITEGVTTVSGNYYYNEQISAQ